MITTNAVNGTFTKESLINGFDWFGSQQIKQYVTDCDLTISKHKNGYGFIFRNESEKKLGDKFGRVEFCFVRPGVIAFRSSPNGYRFNKKRQGKNSKYIAIKPRKGMEVLNQLDDYIGNYDLEIDKNFGICYIDIEKRKFD